MEKYLVIKGMMAKDSTVVLATNTDEAIAKAADVFPEGYLEVYIRNNKKLVAIRQLMTWRTFS